MIDEKFNKIGWFVAFMVVSNSTTILPFSWGILYYMVLALTLFFILCAERIKLEESMLLLFFICALSILGNDIPSFFRPWPRLGTFILLTSIFSYVIRSEKAVALRVKMFITVSKLLVIVTFISFIYLCFGLGYGTNKFNPWFQGITVHSMIMGPVAAMSNLYCVYQLQYEQKEKYMRYVYYFLIVGGFICLLQTGSRSALIGAVISVIAFMFYIDKNDFFALIKKYIWVLILLLASSPVWLTYTDKIEKKNAGVSQLNTRSRSKHWEQRIIEWKSSPIIGIGFGSVDSSAEGSNFDETTGGVESGSSWLCVLSMTGLLGFICVSYIVINAYRKTLALMDVSRATGSYLLSIIIFFIFHMMAEGYIYAGGNFLNTQFWLVIGLIYGITCYPEFANVLEEELQLRGKE